MLNAVSDKIILISDQLKQLGERLPPDLVSQLESSYVNILQKRDVKAMADFESLKSPDVASSVVGDIVTLQLLCISRAQRYKLTIATYLNDDLPPAVDISSIPDSHPAYHILNQAFAGDPNIDPMDRLFCYLLDQHLRDLSLANLSLIAGSCCLADKGLQDSVQETLMQKINSVDDVLLFFSVAVDGCYELMPGALDIRDAGFEGLFADSLPRPLMALLPTLFEGGGDLKSMVTIASGDMDAGSALWAVPILYDLKGQDAELYFDALIDYGYDVNTRIDGESAIDLLRHYDEAITNHVLHSVMRREAGHYIEVVPETAQNQESPTERFRI